MCHLFRGKDSCERWKEGILWTRIHVPPSRRAAREEGERAIGRLIEPSEHLVRHRISWSALRHSFELSLGGIKRETVVRPCVLNALEKEIWVDPLCHMKTRSEWSWMGQKKEFFYTSGENRKRKRALNELAFEEISCHQQFERDFRWDGEFWDLCGAVRVSNFISEVLAHFLKNVWRYFLEVNFICFILRELTWVGEELKAWDDDMKTKDKTKRLTRTTKHSSDGFTR